MTGDVVAVSLLALLVPAGYVYKPVHTRTFTQVFCTEDYSFYALGPAQVSRLLRLWCSKMQSAICWTNILS